MESGSTNVVSAFLDAGADVNKTNDRNETTLIIEMRMHHKNKHERLNLSKAGANVRAANHHHILS